MKNHAAWNEGDEHFRTDGGPRYANREVLVDSAELSERKLERLWPDEREEQHAECDEQWAMIAKLPERERTALLITMRVNPLNTSEQLPRYYVNPMAKAAGMSNQSWRSKLVQRARKHLAEMVQARARDGAPK